MKKLLFAVLLSLAIVSPASAQRVRLVLDSASCNSAASIAFTRYIQVSEKVVDNLTVVERFKNKKITPQARKTIAKALSEAINNSYDGIVYLHSVPQCSRRYIEAQARIMEDFQRIEDLRESYNWFSTPR